RGSPSWAPSRSASGWPRHCLASALGWPPESRGAPRSGRRARTCYSFSGSRARPATSPPRWRSPRPRPRRAHALHLALTSAAWLVQAVALMRVGWASGSAFLRWMGLGLFGVTVVKFIAVDLQTVDAFWRFLTAI